MKGAITLSANKAVHLPSTIGSHDCVVRFDPAPAAGSVTITTASGIVMANSAFGVGTTHVGMLCPGMDVLDGSKSMRIELKCPGVRTFILETDNLAAVHGEITEIVDVRDGLRLPYRHFIDGISRFGRSFDLVGPAGCSVPVFMHRESAAGEMLGSIAIPASGCIDAVIGALEVCKGDEQMDLVRFTGVAAGTTLRVTEHDNDYAFNIAA